jgi:prepilin-type processing-associated H-X9-DG protein
MHNHLNDHNRFPAAGKGEPVKDKPETGSWCFRILPYIEQDNLHRVILQGQAANTAVPTLYTPQRRPPAVYDKAAKSDYAGNFGTTDDPDKPDKEDGAFTKEGARIAGFADGTSNTLLLGVKGLRTTEYLTGKGAGDKGSCWTGGTIDTLRSSNGPKRPPARDVPNADNERGFGSTDAGGCNFAFCDGHVRSIRYKIKGEVFEALCTRAGGEVIPGEDF